MTYQPKSLEYEILSLALYDWIQLSETLSVAHFVVGVEEGEALFEAVRASFLELLSNGLVLIGDLKATKDDGRVSATFVPWTGSPEENTNRVIAEWRTLDRWPGLDEVCWLDLTDKGVDFARRLVGESIG